MSIHTYGNKRPVIPADCFVADNAALIGDIVLGRECSVWFGAVIRTENEPIRIGKQTNVQDNCVVHTYKGFSVTIGDRVTVGHGAIVHGASVSSNCLIGMGAILLNDAVIGENCIVAAGSLVTEGTKMPGNTLVMGSPAIAKRKLNDDEIALIQHNVDDYNGLRSEYLKKSRQGE